MPLCSIGVRANVQARACSLSESCFVDCVRDFTSREVTERESRCATNCMDKYLKMTQRLSLRFQEHQLMQQQQPPTDSK